MRAFRSSRRFTAMVLASGGVVGMASAPAWATDYHWVVANGTWASGSVWNPAGEPGSADIASIDLSSNAVCTVVNSVPSVRATVITNGDTLNIEHSGTTNGSLTSTDLDVLNGTLNVVGHTGTIVFGGVGQLSVISSSVGMFVNGVVNQTGTGESVTVGASTLDSSGKTSLTVNGGYNLDGGLLTAAYVLMNSGAMNLNGGTANLGGISVGGVVTQTTSQMNIGSFGSSILTPIPSREARSPAVTWRFPAVLSRIAAAR